MDETQTTPVLARIGRLRPGTPWVLVEFGRPGDVETANVQSGDVGLLGRVNVARILDGVVNRAEQFGHESGLPLWDASDQWPAPQDPSGFTVPVTPGRQSWVVVILDRPNATRAALIAGEELVPAQLHCAAWLLRLQAETGVIPVLLADMARRNQQRQERPSGLVLAHPAPPKLQ